MRKLAWIALSGVAALGLAGCDTKDEVNVAANDVDTTTIAETETPDAGAWPEGSRIVVEEGVTYRIDPGGTRVALGPNDSRVVVVDGIRYRVDPGGTRVRIDEQGAVISVGPDGIDADVELPGDTAVEVNTN